ncbi:hypothetical protein R3P38DRAFT_2781380 [Favolaschia claudopus]|uniref:F-box domain-containing protein n=1 Tax=Favolaschia claudopus TaxID=2862362 RepID=A0AAW0B5B3_9AGAR
MSSSESSLDMTSDCSPEVSTAILRESDQLLNPLVPESPSNVFSTDISYIGGLPVEIIARLLRVVVLDARFIDVSSIRRTVRHVCRLWGAVVDSDPHCWKSVFLNSNTSKKELRACAMRCGAVPLSFAIDCRVSFDLVGLLSLVERISIFEAVLSQCRSLDLYVQSMDLCSVLMQQLRQLPFGPLVSFHTSMVSPYSKGGLLQFPDFPVGSLEHVTFTFVFPKWVDLSHFASLTSMDIINVASFPRPSVTDIHKLMRAAPLLERLKVHYIDADMMNRDDFRVPPMVTMDNLRHIDFAMRWPRFGAFLHSIEAPALRSLVLKLDDEEEILPFLEACGDKLKLVHFLALDCHLPRFALLEQILAFFPGVVELDGRRCHLFTMAFHALTFRLRKSYPTLRRVVFGDLSFIVAADILLAGCLHVDTILQGVWVSADTYMAPSHMDYYMKEDVVVCVPVFKYCRSRRPSLTIIRCDLNLCVSDLSTSNSPPSDCSCRVGESPICPPFGYPIGEDLFSFLASGNRCKTSSSPPVFTSVLLNDMSANPNNVEEAPLYNADTEVVRRNDLNLEDRYMEAMERRFQSVLLNATPIIINTALQFALQDIDALTSRALVPTRVLPSRASSVVQSPLLWSTLVISPSSNSTSIRAFLDTSFPRTFRVLLTDEAAVLFSTWYHSMPGLLRLALQDCLRWSSFEVAVSDPVTLRAVLDIVAQYGPMPVLAELKIHWSPSAPTQLTVSVPEAIPSSTLAALHLHRVRVLEILALPFPALQTLTLADLPSDGFPTGALLYQFLSSCPLLWDVALIRVAIDDRGSLPLHTSPLHLWKIRRLRLDFEGEYSLVATLAFLAWLGRLMLPALSDLSLSFATEDDLVRYTTAALRFPASSVAISGTFVSPNLIRSFFDLLLSVTRLDLVECPGRAVLMELGGRRPWGLSSDSMACLPRLTHIVVCPAYLEELYEGVLARSSRRAIITCLELVDTDPNAPRCYVPLTSMGRLQDLRAIVPSVRWSTRFSPYLVM